MNINKKKFYNFINGNLQEIDDFSNQLKFVHGTNTSIFVILSKTNMVFLSTSKLIERGLIPFSGELKNGIGPGGVNENAISGCHFKLSELEDCDIITSLQYSLLYKNQKIITYVKLLNKLHEYIIDLEAKPRPSKNFGNLVNYSDVWDWMQFSIIIMRLKIWDYNKFIESQQLIFFKKNFNKFEKSLNIMNEINNKAIYLINELINISIDENNKKQILTNFIDTKFPENYRDNANHFLINPYLINDFSEKKFNSTMRVNSSFMFVAAYFLSVKYHQTNDIVKNIGNKIISYITNKNNERTETLQLLYKAIYNPPLIILNSFEKNIIQNPLPIIFASTTEYGKLVAREFVLTNPILGKNLDVLIIRSEDLNYIIKLLPSDLNIKIMVNSDLFNFIFD